MRHPAHHRHCEERSDVAIQNSALDCRVAALLAMTCIILVFLLCCTKGFACEVTDDLGRVVSLAHPAKRIISLAPDATENLFAIGAGNRMVGVMQGSDYPLAAKKIPVVARYNAIDTELILSLHPDLIVAWTGNMNSKAFEKAGIAVYVSRPKKLTDIPITLQKLGCLVGHEKMANEVSRSYVQRYATLAKQYKQAKPVTVFYQLWPNPLMTITKQSWINEAINLCGGRNIFADLKTMAPEVTIESVIIKNPDMIIGADKKDAWKMSWQSWRSLRAVKHQLLVNVDPDLIERASIRLLDGVSQLCIAMDYARKKLEYENGIY
jgi:iron complex transport system substrate-binding protein